MRRKIMVAACAFAAAVAFAAGAKTVDFPIPDEVRSWDIPERDTNGVKAVWIENVPWRGKPTRFFAYYSLPDGATEEKKVPGIVLVHGGHGTAFHTWVKLWNDRGYAAIAMDNCGGIPGAKSHTPEHPRHEWSGPNGWGRYEEEALPPEEQWVYHAIECVIRSHTFLRNLPEVDASKIGVTGISWGGFLTSIACGADQRFAFAVPVYGCGNLRRHSVFAPEIGELWESLWNPVEYAKNCRIPTLWCTGTNDYFFPLDSFEETAFAAGNPLFSIKLRMKHGHPPDGDPPEIAAFADSVVKGGRKLADRKIARREWLYTESANPVWKDRPFEVSLQAPQNWTIRFENAITEDGLILSSPPEFQTATLDAKGVVVNGATIRETEPGLSSAWLYPQMDMELFRVHQMRDDVRRAGLYAYHPGVLPPLRDKAEFRRVCAEDDPLPEAFRRISETHYDSAEGRRYVTVDGGLMGGGAIRSAETNWEARVFDGSWRPVAAYPDAPVPPHRERLPVDRSFSGLVATNGWYDALAEQFAYVECRANAEPRLFVGESIPEMLAEKPEDFEYDATMDEVSDGCWRTRHALAFRYLRFGSEVTNVKVVPVGRRRPVKGRIVTDNARWRKMVEVGERTLALCSNDFLVDGIKRDRLPWGGDLTVSLMADAYVYGDAEIARRTLSVMDAYEGDVNGIVTYSMWTVVSHDLYQLYFGDAQFLRDRWWRIKARVNDLMSRTDETGFVVRGLDWVFVDWAKPKSDTALQMIWYGSLQAAARLADRVGDPQADDYRALAAKIRESLNRLAWDEPRGLYRADPTDAAVFGRQANIFAVVFGVADDRQSVRIGDELAQDRLPPVGTPYVFGWEMVALARTGHAGAFFSGLERIFGGMLDNGATTYWESYDPKETGDERYAFYGRPWAKSLCHVWSAWPAFIFVSEGLGIRPTADGWRAWSYRPLQGCENLKAEIPTPNGILRVGGAGDWRQEGQNEKSLSIQ